MRIVDHVASLAAGRAGQRGGKYSMHCSFASALTTNVHPGRLTRRSDGGTLPFARWSLHKLASF